MPKYRGTVMVTVPCMVELTVEAASPEAAEALLKAGAGLNPSLPFKPQWDLADENRRELLNFGLDVSDTTFYFHCDEHVPTVMFELKGVATSTCPGCGRPLQPYYSETET